MEIYAYMRASTSKQDANRSRLELINFASQHNKEIHGFYSENCSGTTKERPQLVKLLNRLCKNDVILIESMDRLTRLKEEDYKWLKRKIDDAGAYIVSVDIPLTHRVLKGNQGKTGDGISDSMNNLITNLLIDIGASFARSDYEQRRKRQQQGIEKAKALGKYKGRKKDHVKRNYIKDLLIQTNFTYKKITDLTGAQPQLIASVSKEISKTKS